MIASPCKDCGRREIGCHSSCEAYIEYAKERAAARKARYEEGGNQPRHLAYHKIMDAKGQFMRQPSIRRRTR